VERKKNKSHGLYINNYNIKKILGKGSYGKVKLCEDSKNGI
jgi:serine/threonine protein kinase